MMRISSLSLAAVSAVAVLSVTPFLALGCGGSDTTTPDGGIRLQDFAHKYDDALCAVLTKCGQMPDAATCKRVQAADPQIAQGVASVVFGALQYDPVAATACLTALQASKCEGSNGLPQDVQDACDKVFTNRQKNGGPCFVGLECASGKCKPPASCADACCVGTCDDLGDRIPLDGACGGMVTKLCATGTFCDKGTSKCTNLKAANDPCAQDDACAAGFACDLGGAGVCFKASDPGGSCNPALKVNPCTSLAEYCEPTSSKCTLKPQPGQPCTMSGLCAGDGYCAATVCKLLPIEGEDCGGTPCLGSLVCSSTMMNGKCLPSDGASTCVAPQ